jgi:post-segregation antitoxin (ccd killing protein)
MKLTIYVPDPLAAEAKRAALSLSPICQQAIREELNRVRARRAATNDLEAVAARLRATVGEQQLSERDEGHNDGGAWAREWATAGELRSLAERFSPSGGGAFDSGHSVLDFFAAKRGENTVNVQYEDSDYWRGFVEGARGVYEAVRSLL